MIRYVGQLSCLLIACLFARKHGGAPERATAATLALMYVLDPAYHFIWGNLTIYQTVNIGHLAIDAIMMALLLPIALFANRRWTLLTASAQAVALLSHFLRSISPEMNQWVYAAFIRGPSYLQIALLFIGTERHRRRVILMGSYPSWRVFSSQR